MSGEEVLGMSRSLSNDHICVKRWERPGVRFSKILVATLVAVAILVAILVAQSRNVNIAKLFFLLSQTRSNNLYSNHLPRKICHDRFAISLEMHKYITKSNITADDNNYYFFNRSSFTEIARVATRIFEKRRSIGNKSDSK